MSQDMTSASAYFTTANMLPEKDEFLAAAWARSLANNTGWLSWQWGLLGQLRGPDGTQGYAFVAAGAYVVQGYAVGSQSVTFDGTTVVNATAKTGSITWAGTTDWYPITTDAAAGEYASLWLRRA